jgi:threonine synthase
LWKTGAYEKKPVEARDVEGGLGIDDSKMQKDGCKEILSPAMDILVSSNFERLIFLLAKGTLCQWL